MSKAECEHKFERHWVMGSYLFWECSKCLEQQTRHFSDMDDEDWEWVKQYFRQKK